MTSAVAVAEGLWLGSHQPPRPRLRREPMQRIRDRSAARRALDVALKASGFQQRLAAVSLSHTEGVGAALVGSRGRLVGVDVVRIARLRRRHADAILHPGEWRALGGHGSLSPALAWGLKEAAAKAVGAPELYFPTRLRIVACAAGRALVLALGAPPLWLAGGWLRRGRFLYVWVAAVGTAGRKGGSRRGAAHTLPGGRGTHRAGARDVAVTVPAMARPWTLAWPAA